MLQLESCNSHKCLLLPYNSTTCMQHVQKHQLLYFLLTCMCLMSIPSAQSLVRGGIRVTGNFEYKIEPEACIKVNIMTESKPGEEVPHNLCTQPEDGIRIKPQINVTDCTAMYDSWPNCYVDLYAYYQTRSFTAKWPVSLHVHTAALRQKGME